MLSFNIYYLCSFYKICNSSYLCSLKTMLTRWLLLCCVVLLARPAHPQGAQQCPASNTITPCSCTVKKNGLDILCEFTEQQHIQKVSIQLVNNADALVCWECWLAGLTKMLTRWLDENADSLVCRECWCAAYTAWCYSFGLSNPIWRYLLNTADSQHS